MGHVAASSSQHSTGQECSPGVSNPGRLNRGKDQAFLQAVLGEHPLAEAQLPTAVLALVTAALGVTASSGTMLLFLWADFPAPVRGVAFLSWLLFALVFPLYRWGAHRTLFSVTLANHCIPAALFVACGFSAVYLGGHAPMAMTYAAAIPLVTVMLCGTVGAVCWTGAMVLALLVAMWVGPVVSPVPVFPHWIALFGALVMLVPTLVSMLIHRRIWSMAVRNERAAQAQLRHQFVREQELARQLSDSDRAQGLALMAGRVAHDLNNFLASVTGNAELARMAVQQADHANVDCAINAIEVAAADAGELARQLLNYAGGPRLTLERLSVQNQVADALALARASVDANVQFKLNQPSVDLWVDGDPTQLNQLLINLLRNAARAYVTYPEREPKIWVHLSEISVANTLPTTIGTDLIPGEFVQITVRDRGCGFAEHQVERAFEPFVSYFGGGTGLGLSSVAGIADAHGGGIVVETVLGEGSAIEVYLPIAQLVEQEFEQTSTQGFEQQLAPGRSAEPSAGRPNALVVDDQPAVRQVLGSLLKQLQYEPQFAADGAEGLRCWQARPKDFAVIILDISMPNISGTEMLAEVRATDRELPVVLISGYATREAIEPFQDDPRTEFLQKPFSARRLAEAIEQLST